MRSTIIIICEYEVRTSRGVPRPMMYVTVEPEARMWTMMMTTILKVCLIIYYFVTIIIIIIIITHREITISGVVPKCNSDNTTPDRAWSIERRSLFEAERVCSRCRRGRGSKYARFELHPTSGSKDMYNKLILFRVRVPPCTIHYWNYTRLVLPLVLPMFYWIVWCVADWFEWGNFCYYV